MVALGGMDPTLGGTDGCTGRDGPGHSDEQTEELAGMDQRSRRNGWRNWQGWTSTLGGRDGCTDSNGQTLLEEWTDTLGGMCWHTAVSGPQRRAVKVSKQTRKDSHR